MDRIKEADWEIVERIQEAALERLCRLALEEAQEVVSDSSRSWHQRFETACSVLDDHDRRVRMVVGEIHRSNAFVRLAAMRAADLIPSDEFSLLSEETRHEIESLVDIVYSTSNGRS